MRFSPSVRAVRPSPSAAAHRPAAAEPDGSIICRSGHRQDHHGHAVLVGEVECQHDQIGEILTPVGRQHDQAVITGVPPPCRLEVIALAGLDVGPGRGRRA